MLEHDGHKKANCIRNRGITLQQSSIDLTMHRRSFGLSPSGKDGLFRTNPFGTKALGLRFTNQPARDDVQEAKGPTFHRQREQLRQQHQRPLLPHVGGAVRQRHPDERRRDQRVSRHQPSLQVRGHEPRASFVF